MSEQFYKLTDGQEHTFTLLTYKPVRVIESQYGPRPIREIEVGGRTYETDSIKGGLEKKLAEAGLLRQGQTAIVQLESYTDKETGEPRKAWRVEDWRGGGNGGKQQPQNASGVQPVAAAQPPDAVTLARVCVDVGRDTGTDPAALAVGAMFGLHLQEPGARMANLLSRLRQIDNAPHRDAWLKKHAWEVKRLPERMKADIRAALKEVNGRLASREDMPDPDEAYDERRTDPGLPPPEPEEPPLASEPGEDSCPF